MLRATRTSLTQLRSLATMAAQQKLNIAIVGGGVCGLTLAVGLQKRGLKAHIYESASKFSEIGAGLGLGANALNVLNQIGAYDEVMKYTVDARKVDLPGFTFVFGNALQDPIYVLDNKGEKSSSPILRSQFLDALVAFVDPTYTHFNKRCLSVTSNPETKVQTLHFKDGTTAEADVVLAANGVKSSLRGIVMGETTSDPDAPPPGTAYSSCASYRGLVRQERAQALGVDTSMWRSPMILIGQDKHVVVYPVAHGKMFNIAAFIKDYSKPFGSDVLPPGQPLSEEVPTEELVAAFPAPDFGPEIQALLRCMESPKKWYINVVWPHLETFVRGRIALVGDAAHAMLPHLGAGAGQGIEDAYLLSELLAHPQTTQENIEEVLQVYSDIRQPRSQRILDLSTESGRVSHGYGQYGFTKEGVQQAMLEVETWREDAYSRPVNEDVDKALEILKAKGVFV